MSVNMRPLVSPIAFSTSTSRTLLHFHYQPQITTTFRSRPLSQIQPQTRSPDKLIRSFFSPRPFSTTNTLLSEEDATSKAKALNQKGLDEEEDGFHRQIDDAVGQAEELQARTPWHREGSDTPPVKRNRSAGAMTKGKLLTTPSRLLKLILPLTTQDKNSDRKSIEPLALLVHPQQPLSYLERLIQSELPMIKGKDGKEKVAQVYFRAEDSARGEIKPDLRKEEEDEDLDNEDGEERREGIKQPKEEGSDEQMIDGKLMKVGKISSSKDQDKPAEKDNPQPSSSQPSEPTKRPSEIEHELRGGPGEGGVESYSGQGRESTDSTEQKFVRWSSSTEIGDFIRDAARGKEFAVEIEGASKEIRVGVPSFNDRTHYLRVRLRKTSKKLASMASIKNECDKLAHRSAQRLAMGGFGILVGWWGAIYHFTFRTDYGWDTMEPVTYLAGLSTIILGYLWFLYHNREVSYRAALNLTVSRRQNTLYTARGFDLAKWEAMIDEANALRKEIKNVADEYDVEWDEKADEATEEVHDALKAERKKSERGDEDGDEKKTKKEKEKSKEKEQKASDED